MGYGLVEGAQGSSTAPGTRRCLRCGQDFIRRLSQSDEILKLRIEPANWWLRWIVSRIDITYDASKRRVLAYEGITDMRDEHGRRYRARLDFDYGTSLL